jgi:hypothetical protein
MRVEESKWTIPGFIFALCILMLSGTSEATMYNSMHTGLIAFVSRQRWRDCTYTTSMYVPTHRLGSDW